MPIRAGRRKKKRRSLVSRYFRKLTVFLFSHVGLAAVSVAYMISGAIVFKYLESPHENETRRFMHSARERLKHSTWIAVKNNYTVVDDHLIESHLMLDWEEYKWTTIGQIRRGFDGRQLVMNIQWSFSGAFFYSLTTISTVGYGNIACRTTMGRAVTILYAIFGIPIMLLFLAITGDTFSISTKFVYRAYVRQRIRFIEWKHQRRMNSRVNSALGRLIRAQVYHTAAMYGIIPPAKVNEALLEEGRQEVKEVTVPILVLTVIMISYLVAGATLFSLWEEWTFEEAFYFCFVSLALIGFGDLFPGAAVIDSDDARNKIIICAMYLLFGMALIAMCFNLAQEDVIKMAHKAAVRLGIGQGSRKLTRRGSRSIDLSQVIVEGGPVGGPDEPLTLGDVHAVLTAAGILSRSHSLKRPRPTDVDTDLGCDTPPSTSSAPIMTESTRLIVPNGNPVHHQEAMDLVRMRRDYESSSYLERRPRFGNAYRRRMNDYEFV